MNQSLVVLFVALIVTVVIALAIVVALLRTRRPSEGMRTWVREATDAWKNDELDEDAAGQMREVSIDELWTEAEEATDSQADIRGLIQPEAEADAQPQQGSPELPSFAPASNRRRPRLANVAAATPQPHPADGAVGGETEDTTPRPQPADTGDSSAAADALEGAPTSQNAADEAAK
ncbi:MAG: hypothetical protein E7A62_03875 [Actinomycetaceae bacterium]|nr:hypothetical protein [Actinomycetaceae bacterium]MDU0970124.1 hypothetical protein [Actinomycetaceae bacterium]